MITKKSIEIWSSGKVKELYPNILKSLDIDKINNSPYASPILNSFEKICDEIDREKETSVKDFQALQAFKVIDDNIRKCYVEVIPESDGTYIFPKPVFSLNITYSDFFTKNSMDRSGCLELFKYLKLREVNRVEKKINNFTFTRTKITDNGEGNTLPECDPKKLDVVNRLTSHYSELYNSDDALTNEFAFFDLLELTRERPRDKALWLNLEGGFGKDVLITLLSNFWQHRTFTEDINDDMNNAPRVRAEREYARTNAEIWNRPELKKDASKQEIERRVQSIKTHTGRTRDIIELNGDIRVNSAFTIETTNADLELRNDRDILRRFIVFKFEGTSLIDRLTKEEISKAINGDYETELSYLYYLYVKAGYHENYMERLSTLSTPISEVIGEETKEIRDLVPKAWRKYSFIPKLWSDNVVEKNSKYFEHMKLKEKMSVLSLGVSKNINVEVTKIDRKNKDLKVVSSETITARENKLSNSKGIKPTLTLYGTFDENGSFTAD